MGGLFNLDGPFYKFGSMLWDIMALSFLWLIFSIPIFTIGASTTALYFVTTRRVSKKEGYLTKDFWTSFSSNFKQSTKVWLCIMVVGMLLLWNLYYMFFETEALIDVMPQAMLMIMLPLQVLFFIELTLFTIYVFPIISRFEISGKMLFKTTMLMAHKHLPTTVLLILMLSLLLFSTVYYLHIMLILFSSGIYAYAASYFFVRIFKKYRPEMDKDDDELAEQA